MIEFRSLFKKKATIESLDDEYQNLTVEKEKIQRRLNEVEVKQRELRRKCEHEIICDAFDEDGEPEDWACAVCLKCDKDLSWWCPDSPEHICDYEHIILRGMSRFFTAEEKATGKYYNDDECRYCHEPNERK